MNPQTTPEAEKKPLAGRALSRALGRITREFGIICLRETPLEDQLAICETPEEAAEYWRANISTDPRFNPEVESLYVLMLNTRRVPRGHHLVAQGILDTILCHPREVFRAAIISGASAIVPDAQPSVRKSLAIRSGHYCNARSHRRWPNC